MKQKCCNACSSRGRHQSLDIIELLTSLHTQRRRGEGKKQAFCYHGPHCTSSFLLVFSVVLLFCPRTRIDLQRNAPFSSSFRETEFEFVPLLGGTRYNFCDKTGCDSLLKSWSVQLTFTALLFAHTFVARSIGFFYAIAGPATSVQNGHLNTQLCGASMHACMHASKNATSAFFPGRE